MESLIQDLRFALRMLRRSPGVSAIAVLSLGVGIGANTAIASLVDAVFLRPLPVEEPAELVWIYRTFEPSATGQGFFGAGLLPTSYLNYLDFAERSASFEGLLAASGGGLGLSGDGEPEQVPAGYVTANYFDVLGVSPALGRGFEADDNRRGGARPVTVISDALWRSRFGAAPDVIGREIALNGRDFTVVGVTPPDFHGLLTLFEEKLWVPAEIWPELNRGPSSIALGHRGFRMFWMVGRLRNGITREASEQELAGIAAGLAEEHPDLNRDRGVRVASLSEGALNLNQRGMFVRAGVIATAAVGLVLLIACVNVGSLLTARARARQAETAMRLSLGAPRRRLLRQWLTESLLLALLGGVAGWLIALWTRPLLLRLRPPFLDEFDVPLDLRVLGFTAAISLLAGLLFGLAPALRASRTDLAGQLGDRGRFAGIVARRFSLRRALVVGQVALSAVALCLAGLFLRSLEQARAIDPGFDVDSLGIVGLDAGALGLEQAEGQALFERLLEETTALPEVSRAALAQVAPLGFSPERRVFPEGAEELVGSEGVYTPVNAVTPGFFATMGVELVEGRLFDGRDRIDGRPVAVVNETAQRTYWPQGALGRTIRWPVQEEPWEIVGVVSDMKYGTLGEEPQPYVYRPLAQEYSATVVLHVRAQTDPAAALEAVRTRIRPLAPDLPLLDPQPVESVIEQSLWAPAFGARLLSTFGLLALLLAGVGIYGVVSQHVAERRREVGIRLALGADRSRVLSQVLRDGMAPVALGVALGLAVTFVLVRQVRALLYQSAGADVAVFVASAVILGLIALLACAVPAGRAMRVDPVRTLRAE